MAKYGTGHTRPRPISNGMKNSLKITIIALAVLALFFILYSIFQSRGSKISTATSTPDTAATIKSYEYTQEYSHPTYHFSFKYPDGFTVSTIPPVMSEVEPSADNGQGETVLVESADSKAGVQIVISPYGSDVDITAEMIARDIPEMKVSDAQELLVGEGRKGLAFMSDNPAFCASPEPCAEEGNGKAREVWFVFGGNLYQISTYAEQDEFLKGLFGTWQFKQ